VVARYLSVQHPRDEMGKHSRVTVIDDQLIPRTYGLIMTIGAILISVVLLLIV
jgi:hypothetical protein